MAKKVLIIDDSPDEAYLAAQALNQAGFSTLYQNNALEASKIIYDFVPDLIILDVLMPDMGGYELCRLIKADDVIASIPVIIYTRLQKNIDKFWAYRSGAAGFISKGEPTNSLVESAKKIIEAHPLTPECKSRIIGAKIPDNNTFANDTNDKKTLLDAFRAISESDTDEQELAIKIFRIIYPIFKYDMAALCFSDTLIFDIGDLIVEQDVFNQIKQTTGVENAKVVSKRNPLIKINDVSDFNIKYEFETDIASKPIGCLCLYVKERLNSSKIKLIDTIKTEVEHIIRTKYLKNTKQEGSADINVKKLYTQLDFDRLINHESDWHKRNNMPLGLALIEIDSLENIKNQTDEEYADIIVAKVSNILTQCLAQGEFIYRNEDNIFAILMTNSDYTRLCGALEYIKSSIEDPLLNDFEEDEAIKLNIGAIMYNENYKNHYEFIDAAYDALDEARRNSNLVVARM